MKKFMIVLAAAGTVAMAAPAAAQVRIDAGPGGVEVGVGGHRHGHWRHGYARGHCRTERVEVTRPNGRVIVKTRRVCG
jgi:hypothetical protein